MRRVVAALLVSYLFFALISYVYKANVPAALASPGMHQGDLILAGNNVTIIDEPFDINGSIIVTENATLILNNAVVNFTQTTGRQFNMTFENPVNGNPRLLAYNSTITSGLDLLVYLNDNSTAIINNSIDSQYFLANDNSTLTVSNSSYIQHQYGYDFSTIKVYNSTIGEWHNYDSPQVEVYDSKISNIVIGSTSVNCTISGLKPGNFGFWNFLTNCSVTVLLGGYCPSVTLTNTTVTWWRFIFYGSSNAAITDSTVGEASSTDSSVLRLKRSSVGYTFQSSPTLWADDSSIDYLSAVGSSTSWFLNTTYNTLNIQDSAKVHVSWYLDVHVVDAINQDVPSANVTVTYANMTIADSQLTDNHGWVRFTLTEKTINATGEYSVGNYTVEATYLAHSNSTTANMTTNKQIELAFEDFVIPEFAHFLILPLFMMSTLLAIILYRKKNTVELQ
jgi:hypothetical protein